jgi:hypothetical protein
MTHKKPPRERFPARIALRRERGATPASIAQYAHLIIMQTGLSPDALGLFAAERVLLDELLAARAERVAEACARQERA